MQNIEKKTTKIKTCRIEFYSFSIHYNNNKLFFKLILEILLFSKY